MHRILLIFFLFFAGNSFAAKVSILNWQENAQLNGTGKTSEVLFQAKASDLKPGYGLTSFSIIFDDKQKIKITQAKCDDKIAKYNFAHNELTIQFPTALKNNSSVWVYFSYEEKYDQINRFLREEAIFIPEFAAGAKAKVALNFSSDYESATFNSHIIKEDGRFIYSNTVPQNGVRELVKLTPSQSTWDVNVEVKVKSEKPLDKISFSFPNYFQSPAQKVENYAIATNATALEQKLEQGRRKFTFAGKKHEIIVQNRATIFTGKKYRQPFTRNPAAYSKVSEEERILLSDILEKIKRSRDYEDLPLYAKIGKFVHDYIKYDANYVGRLPQLKDLLQNPVGVCTEYAKLYSALARLAGIPALIIHGGACGEPGKCEGHSWNAIYYNGKWMEVDATWNLMSGIVSSSHIYLNDEYNDEVSSEYRDNGGKITSSIDLKIKNLL